MGKAMTKNSIPILLVLHKDVNRLAQQLIGSIVYVVKVQMGKQYAVYVVDNIFRLHRQVVERVAQLLMVREREWSKRSFTAEHGINEESLSCILDNDGGISNLLNLHNLNGFEVLNNGAKVVFNVKFNYTIISAIYVILINQRKYVTLPQNNRLWQSNDSD